MAKTALTQLQDQIEAIRREAFAAGYAAAMQAIREAASHPAPDRPGPGVRVRQKSDDGAAAPRPRGRPRAVRPAARRPQRGSNARLIEEVLQAIAPRAARPTEIRSTLQRDKGVALAFTSIRHALGQLAARRAVEAAADGKSWRHCGEAPGTTA